MHLQIRESSMSRGVDMEGVQIEKKVLNHAESYDFNDTFQKKAKNFWRKYSKNKLAVIGLCLLTILYGLAIFAPVIAPYAPEGTAADIFNANKEPSLLPYEEINLKGEVTVYKPNYFGRDELGRDVFSRCLYAGRISLSVGLVSVGISVVIGTAWGAIAGYYGGAIDSIMMRIVDALMSIPIFILLITIMSVFGGGIYAVMIVLGITGWTGISRFVRAEFLTLMSRDYIEAAKGLGASDFRVIFIHVLPNAIGPIIVSATMGVAGAILSESSLSFFGLGVQPPTASWGNMLSNAQDLSTMLSSPWKAFFPGALIFITVLSFNFVGDGLREVLDPRSK
jgi:peptide/nickel transport system permease protein